MHGCVARSVAEGSSTPFVLVSSSTRCSPRHLVFAVERKVPEGIHLAAQEGGGQVAPPEEGQRSGTCAKALGRRSKMLSSGPGGDCLMRMGQGEG